MKRIGAILFTAFFATTLLSSQEAAQPGLQDAFQLNRQGRFAELVEAAQPLANDKSLSPLVRGQAAMLVGLGKHQVGKFQESAAAYEQSLRLLGSSPQYAGYYAATLIAYGTLYHDMGRIDDAQQLQGKALSIYEKTTDHTGIAMACKSLASIALAGGHKSEGRKFLERAANEAKLSAHLNPDFFASLYSMQGKLAELEKKHAVAVAGYRRALNVWEAEHGDRHVLVGWGYILLGKASAEAGQTDAALEQMRKGLSILGDTVGPVNVHYLAAELAYAHVLDAAGSHSQADDLAKKDQGLLKNFYSGQCLQCSVSVAALALH
jgi:tetratricopeptide (TPR) repeat protein